MTAPPRHTLRLELVGPDGRRGSAEMAPREDGPLTVGRGPDNDLQIVSAFVSRRHGVFTREGDALRYVDLGSTSGSYVQGRRVSAHTLRPGDQLHLGSPDGDCLTLLRGGPEEDADPDSDTKRSPFSLTDVLQVSDLSQSQYLAQKPRARGRRANSQTERRLRALIRLTSELLEVEDADSMARRLLTQVMRILPVDRGMVLLGGPDEFEPRVWLCRSVRATSDFGTDVSVDFSDELSLDSVDFQEAEQSDGPPFDPIGTVVRRVADDGVGLLTLNAGADARLEGSESIILQGVRSILAAPIAASERVYGVLYLDAKRALRRGDEDALEWLVAAARQAGTVAQKLELLAQQRAMVESTMRGLAASIDARDGLTAGHSARVAHHSRETARFMGMSPEQVEIVHYAGLLHDYGKIGVDDAVLKKPGRLNEAEFAHVRTHAKQTFDILSKIEFPPHLAGVPMMAASHHERVDGEGYPWGLSGNDIPIAGRIIAVADVYDSLTRKRHYRDPMPLPEVLEHLEEGRDTRFDTNVLDAFFRYHAEVLGPKEERRRLKRARTTAKTSPVQDEDTVAGEGLEPATIRRRLNDPGTPTRDFPESG